MKKLFLFAVVASVVTFGFTSCKKDYDCTCTTAAGVKTTTTFPKTTKSDATDACNALSAISAIGGGSCSLN